MADSFRPRKALNPRVGEATARGKQGAMSTVSLLIGGARSGKSRRALEMAFRQSAPHVFIATAEAHDEEMRTRIDRHRDERGPTWQTVEAPLDLAGTITGAEGGTILVDCCTLWLSNLMLAGRDVEQETAALLQALRDTPACVFLVTNEVGAGIVPETPLGRHFRDEQGRLNQRLAAAADTVELVVAGLPLRLKG